MSCLLAIDIGNTNTVLGVYRGEDLVCHGRFHTSAARTADEYSVLLRALLSQKGVDLQQISHGVVSSVVPPAVLALEEFLCDGLQVPVTIVGPGIKTNMPILYENPREVGADRIVNAIAAYDRFRRGCIVVDFGTATTWDVVTPRGEYLGGVIAPGVQISAQSLYLQASKLPSVQIAPPKTVIGRNTVASMQSGLYFGYAGMVDSMVEKIREELDFDTRCIATGGLAELLAGASRSIESIDSLLTLQGLRILFERNQ